MIGNIGIYNDNIYLNSEGFIFIAKLCGFNEIKLIKSIPIKGKSFYPSLCNENVVYHSYIRGETSEVFLNNKQITKIGELLNLF